MNTFMNITKNFVIVCFLNLVSITAFTKSPNNAEIITRLESLNTIIDMRITEEVLTQVNYSVEKWRYDSQVILGRSSMYFPVIENILREKNLPEDLKYIAVIESALLPRAQSRQGASGSCFKSVFLKIIGQLQNTSLLKPKNTFQDLSRLCIC